MAKIACEPKVELQLTLALTEVEARALHALAGYGTTKFIEVFYKELGKAYLEPHVAGIHSLFETVLKDMPPIMSRTDSARQAFKG